MQKLDFLVNLKWDIMIIETEIRFTENKFKYRIFKEAGKFTVIKKKRKKDNKLKIEKVYYFDKIEEIPKVILGRIKNFKSYFNNEF